MTRRLLMFSICAVLLGACTKIIDGREFNYGPQYRNRIVQGSSNKSDVIHLLGEPWRREEEDQVWIYYFKEGDLDSDRERTLRIDFDGNIVAAVKYKFRENNPLKRHPNS